MKTRRLYLYSTLHEQGPPPTATIGVTLGVAVNVYVESPLIVVPIGNARLGTLVLDPEHLLAVVM